MYKLTNEKIQGIGDNDEPKYRNTKEFIKLQHMFLKQNKLLYGNNTRNNIIAEKLKDGNCWIYSIMRLFPEILKNMESASPEPLINNIVFKIRSNIKKGRRGKYINKSTKTKVHKR